MEDEAIEKAAIALLREKIGGGFSDRVIEYGTHPRNCGVMARPDGYGKVTGPCGDTVEVFLRITGDTIEDVSYRTDGCMASHAAVSAAVVLAMGKPLRACIGINQSAILEHLGGLPAEEQHCALLAAMTFQKALRDYIRTKKPGHSGSRRTPDSHIEDSHPTDTVR